MNANKFVYSAFEVSWVCRFQRDMFPIKVLNGPLLSLTSSWSLTPTTLAFRFASFKGSQICDGLAFCDRFTGGGESRLKQGGRRFDSGWNAIV